jgi:excisionase family DNA binding protein
VKLLRIKDVAAQLGIGYGTALALVHSGDLPTVQLPGRRSFLIREEDVDALIARFVSGTTSGTNDKIEPGKTQQNAAPKKQCRKSKPAKSTADKYSWMERYAEK